MSLFKCTSLLTQNTQPYFNLMLSSYHINFFCDSFAAKSNLSTLLWLYFLRTLKHRRKKHHSITTYDDESIFMAFQKKQWKWWWRLCVCTDYFIFPSASSSSSSSCHNILILQLTFLFVSTSAIFSLWFCCI